MQKTVSSQNEEIAKILMRQETVLRNLDKFITYFRKTPHSLDDSETIQDLLLDLDRDIRDTSDDVGLIVDRKRALFQKTKEENRLYVHSQKCIARFDRINKALEADISKMRYLETKRTVDPIKNLTFLAGFPAATVLIAKAIYEVQMPLIVTDACYAALAICGMTVGRKPVVQLIKKVGKALCGKAKKTFRTDLEQILKGVPSWEPPCDEPKQRGALVSFLTRRKTKQLGKNGQTPQI